MDVQRLPGFRYPSDHLSLWSSFSFKAQDKVAGSNPPTPKKKDDRPVSVQKKKKGTARKPSAPDKWQSAGTVRVFRQEFTLRGAIGSHACSLEVCPISDVYSSLPVHTVNCVQTLKNRTVCDPWHDHQLCRCTDDVTTLKDRTVWAAIPQCTNRTLEGLAWRAFLNRSLELSPCVVGNHAVVVVGVEARPCVRSNSISNGCPLPLTVATMHCVATLKAPPASTWHDPNRRNKDHHQDRTCQGRPHLHDPPPHGKDPRLHEAAGRRGRHRPVRAAHGSRQPITRACSHQSGSPNPLREGLAVVVRYDNPYRTLTRPLPLSLPLDFNLLRTLTLTNGNPYP
jgi:hypothetical protein